MALPTALSSLLLCCAAQGGLSEAVDDAIDRGLQRVLAWQRADGSFGGAGHDAAYPMGQTALATWTLLESGLPADDPAVRRAFAYLRERELAKTYSVACYVLALDAARDPALDAEIARAARWLEGAFDSRTRLFGYPGGEPELSNTQFAVLALWTAARHGHRADPALWVELVDGALAIQNDDGGFGYTRADRPYSQGSMTTAGITTLELARQALADEPRYAKAARAAGEGLERAWAWMERHFTLTGNPTHDTGLLLDRHGHAGSRLYMFHYYYVWGVERVAAISGRHAIAGRDWYREGAIELLRSEDPGGGWSYLDTTAFALLFLKRATYSGLEGRARALSTPRAIEWRYTLEPPPEGWQLPGFDDSKWARGAGSFGDFAAAYRQDRTPWEGSDVWLRRTFVHADGAEPPRLFATHDDGVAIWINGVAAASSPVASAPREYALSDAARRALVAGENVLAVHGHDTGGARTVDVRFHDQGGLAARLGNALSPAPRPWMQARPRAGVPFVSRWLVLGPVADKKHAGFAGDPIDAGALRPRAGDRTRGRMWREARARGGRLDLAQALGPADGAFQYAFTWLVADGPREAVLWLGADDGLKVWVDGALVLSHHAHGAATADELPLFLRLSPGAHAVCARVENEVGPCALYARVAGLDGGVAEGVRPVLDAAAPDWSAAAAAHPELFSTAELARHLARLASPLELDLETDLDRLCVAGGAAWHPGAAKARAAGDPHPGKKGLLVLAPAARVLWNARIGSEVRTLVVAWAPAVGAAGSVELTAWVDGAPQALGSDRADATPEPDRRAWRAWTVDVSALAGRDALLELAFPAGGCVDALELR